MAFKAMGSGFESRIGNQAATLKAEDWPAARTVNVASLTDEPRGQNDDQKPAQRRHYPRGWCARSDVATGSRAAGCGSESRPPCVSARSRKSVTRVGSGSPSRWGPQRRAALCSGTSRAGREIPLPMKSRHPFDRVHRQSATRVLRVRWALSESARRRWGNALRLRGIFSPTLG